MSSINLNELKDLTPEQLEIYTAIKNMQLKEIVMWVIIGAFIAILVVLFIQIFGFKSDWQTKTITGSLDGILGYTMYPLVGHFFPAAAKAKKTEKKNIK